jgi:hypothetical protein
VVRWVVSLTWRDRRRGKAPVPMLERWAQAHDAGRVLLDSFTQSELDCVTLDPEYLPAEARGPALQTVTPLLAELEARRSGRGGQGGQGNFTGPASGAAGIAELVAGGDHALAEAAGRLEELGYLRPGTPAPATEPVPAEMAGWSANPPGQPAGVRPVAIGGDLGIVTRMRSQPYWVAELSACPEPGRPELLAAAEQMARPWPVVGRMYAAYRPLGALAERPAGPDGRYPPFALLWEQASLPVLISWCGVNIEAPERAEGALPQSPEPLTAELARQFTSLVQIRLVRGYGQEVRLNLMVVAAGGPRQWVLEGEGGAQVTEVRKVDLANRLVSLLKEESE